ncbi:hypothetical protein E6O75_ATG00336 [Venturia nashicola]|uniref:Uncharacterized protein n=1 Tax=Venturia nashicola TaxID=86259 RepID=A0A4Z1PN24_9PEZI|nr:hypothetical protein E6O75_ATG00336 [Venturia nashicola]
MPRKQALDVDRLRSVQSPGVRIQQHSEMDVGEKPFKDGCWREALRGWMLERSPSRMDVGENPSRMDVEEKRTPSRTLRLSKMP